MPYEYHVKNIGNFKKHKVMVSELNKLGAEGWELINFKANDDAEKTLTGIFKKPK